jgi:hypothetical protein
VRVYAIPKPVSKTPHLNREIPLSTDRKVRK